MQGKEFTMSQEPMTTPTPGVAELPVARPDGCPFDPPYESDVQAAQRVRVDLILGKAEHEVPEITKEPFGKVSRPVRALWKSGQ
jgi:hypothetical protein